MAFKEVLRFIKTTQHQQFTRQNDFKITKTFFEIITQKYSEAFLPAFDIIFKLISWVAYVNRCVELVPAVVF